ncbi:hypothetical protein [Ferrimicrobium sp.]|uniref:hypothetical protein n=1 Tax=Ferrimicrobium sp. TaxID=2926050 RepID=UPI00263659AE|nr:hypothetical protein [Ferrimicrobium sp.]
MLIAVAFMVSAVTIFHQQTMVVPEVGAVSTGLIFFRIDEWRRGPIPFYLVICGAAFLGVEITRYLPLNLIAQIVITLAVILGAVLFFRVPAYPALSAGLLPVYLHLISPLYVLAVIIFMGIPILFIVITERPGLGPSSPIPVNLRSTIIIVGSLGVMVLAVWIVHSPLAVLPPLFVATVENANAPKGRGVRQLTWTALAILGAIELTILLFINLNSNFVVLITLTLALILVTKREIESPPILALAIIPIVFGHATDLRITYLIVIGVALSQIAPPLVASATDGLFSLVRPHRVIDDAYDCAEANFDLDNRA